MSVHVGTRRDGGHCVVAVDGELDYGNAAQLHTQLSRLAEQHQPLRLVLDLAGLGFLDSAGLNVFVRWHKHTTASDGSLALASLKPPVLHVIQVTGLDAVLTICDSVDQALTRDI